MPDLWITLPHRWTLQDTQAGLNVIIAFLCAGCIFVLVRFFWVSAARRIARNKEVPVYSLLSLNTIGETIDIIWLLRKDILTGPYIRLLVQCICVLLLTICALLSGFIARFSSRRTTVSVPNTIPGTLSQRSPDSTYFSSMEANIAISALRNAKFPQDRLLDFWPDPSSEWQYVPSQWANHTWSMQCTYTPAQTLTQNVRAINSDCENSFTEQLPFVDDMWDDVKEEYPVRYGGNTWPDSKTMTRSSIAFAFGDERPDSGWDESLQLYTKMHFRVAALFIEGPIREWDAALPGSCQFEVGPLTSAMFTKAECELLRNTNQDAGRSAEDVTTWGAYPEADHSRVLDVLLEYYGNEWYRELWFGQPITAIEGQELARFYQAYTITRDTKGFLYDKTARDAATTSRMLNVPMDAPQVSLVCVVVCAIAAVLVLIGLLNYTIFQLTNRKKLHRTPQSKLDWMLQTLRPDHVHDNKDLRKRLSGHVGIGFGLHHQHHPQPELVDGGKEEDFDVSSPLNSPKVAGDVKAFG